MLGPNFLVTLLLLWQDFPDVILKILFVSHGGQDVNFCGNLTSSCRSIRFAVTISKNDDKIFVDAVQGNPYKECSNRSEGSIELSKSLSFIGINGTAVIECHLDMVLFNVNNYFNETKVIMFSDLVISTTATVVQCFKTKVELVFKQCTFMKYSIGVNIRGSEQCSIQTINSSFEESRHSGILAKCINLTAHFVNTSFYASPVHLQAFLGHRNNSRMQTNHVFILKCVFDGQRKPLDKELLEIHLFAAIVNVTVHSSRFSNHYGTPHKQKNFPVFLLYDNSYGHKKITTFISLNKLLVENNYSPFSGIHLTCVMKSKWNKMHVFKVELSNSIFKNNSGALKVYMNNGSPKQSRLHSGYSMQLINNTFLNNFNGYVGHYCIILSKSKTYFRSCRFLDNWPGNRFPYAAVITSTRAAVTIFENCYYENTRTNTTSIAVYGEAGGWLWLKGNNTFNILASKTGQTVLLHMPLLNIPRVHLEGSFRILCPPGYILTATHQCRLMTNTKSYCSYIYTSCQQCPRKTYSFERGELYTNISERKVHCRNCPRGGQCEEGRVTAKPNFWGYRNKGEVSFLSCPPNYCCNKDNCPSFNVCTGNRTGSLCGQCPGGMSEQLFNTKCKTNDECTSIIFWPGVLSFLFLYLVFFLYHEEITSFVHKGLSLKLPFNSKIQQSHHQNSNEGTSFVNKHQSKGSGFLKIIFYYYQIINLFRNSVITRRNKQVLGKLENVFSKAFNLVVISIPSFGCPFQNLHPVKKTVILHSIGYSLLVLIGLIYIFTKVFKIVKRCFKRSDDSTSVTATILSFEIANETQGTESRFTVRIASAFTYVSLLMYSSSAEMCFSLLHCVPIGDDLVLFIDGTIKCYQPFQNFLVAYVVFSILPFCLVPVLGSYLLKFDRISVPQFCIACIFPLPFCCFWMYLLLKNCPWRRSNAYDTIEEETDIGAEHNSGAEGWCSRTAILRILLGPFRAHKPVLFFPASFLPWEGFLIFRRLVLVIVLTFIYDNRLKMIVALIICVVILISHMYVMPFVRSRENFMETLSLGTLIVFSGLTLVKALYQGEDFSSSDNSSTLLKSFDIVENILVIIPLTVIIFLVTISLLIRFLFGLQLCVRICFRFVGRLCIQIKAL